MSDPIVLVNPRNRHFTRGRYVFAFDAYGSTVLCVWENTLEDALDEAIDWIADNAPGLLADEAVAEEYNRAIEEGLSEDEAREQAETDTTCGGNAGHYVNSWEWSIVAENPTRTEIIEIIGDRGVRVA